MGNIVIAYGSKTGSTAEVAQEIAKVLAARGHEAEALPFSKVTSLKGYTGIVVGAPVNGMSWMPEAMQFVSRNAQFLKKVPTAYFLLSAVLVEGRPFMQGKARSCLEPALAIAKPVKTAAWGGLLPADLPLPIRLLFGVKKGPAKDGRDWKAIRAWAEELADQFQAVNTN